MRYILCIFSSLWTGSSYTGGLSSSSLSQGT